MSTALDDLPDEITITLRQPVTMGDLVIAELKLREPTAGEMEQWDKLLGTSADLRAISIIAGIPEPLVKKIPVREFNKAARWIGAFLA